MSIKVDQPRLLEPWRVLRRALREAHALGIEFRIRGAEIEITGIERLPDKLRAALDPDLLWEYLGAAEDDEEAIAFLEDLGVESVLVTEVPEFSRALEELDAQQSPFIGIDIETTPLPEFAEPRPSVQVNADGSIGRPKAPNKKAQRPAGIDPHRAKIATVQLYAGGSQCFVFHGTILYFLLGGMWFNDRLVAHAPVPNRPAFVAHNAAFETAFFQHRDRYVEPHLGCTLQAGGLVIGCGFGGEKRSLESVSTEVLGLTPPKALQTSDWGAPKLSPGQIAYAASDAILAYRLWPRLRTEIAKHRRTGAYRLQRSAIPAVAAMERRGLLLDKLEHAKHVDAWSQGLAHARREFLEITGDPPPVNDNQIRDWMLRVAPEAMQSWPRTTTGQALSVEAKHLKRLLDLPGMKQVIEARALQHRLSNFGHKLLDFINPATGRIHCSFNLAATKAGRFSASKPNLQQMPGDKVAPDFRRCFIPEPGNLLIGCDWNQVEMRAAAWISECPVMTAVYAADPVRDLHCETAAAIAHVSPDQVTGAQRQAAKPVNFGSIYGIGAITLSEDAFDNYGILMTEAEAQRALDAFFQTFWGFNDWRWRHWREYKATGRVVVPGSGRTVEAAWEYSGNLRFTQCCNIPIQGICADAMLLAIRLVYERLQGLDAWLVVSIHDELLIEADYRDAARAREILEEAMAEAFVTTFPGAPSDSVADAVPGLNWFAVKHPPEEKV
jgi:DNA polymerase I-like protein with 3'-5' exonuclease and polymerase domains